MKKSQQLLVVFCLMSLLFACAKIESQIKGLLPGTTVTTPAPAVTGAFVGAIGLLSASTGTCAASGVSTSWCTGGTFASSTADGGFSGTRGLVADAVNGFLFISGANRVDKYSLSTGVFIGSIGFTSATSGTCPAAGATNGWCTGGTFAANASGFNTPRGLAIDPSNHLLYVADQGNFRVVKIDSVTGVVIGSIGNVTGTGGTCGSTGAATGWCNGGTFGGGAGDGQYNGPFNVGLDVTGNRLYLAERLNHRVTKINLATGAYIGSVGVTSASTGTCPNSGVTSGWCDGGTFAASSIDGGMNGSSAIAVDPINNFFYIGEASTGRIQKFNLTTGVFIGAVGQTSATSGTCPAAGATTTWCTGGTFVTGTGDGVYNNVTALAVDVVNGHLYIDDFGNNRIAKLSLATGSLIGNIGVTSSSTGSCPAAAAAPLFCTGGTFTTGSADGMFNLPYGMSLDSLGSLYVADFSNFRIVKYK